MEIEDFCHRYPKLMHAASPDAWPSIQKHGLLSTKTIASCVGLSEAECEKLCVTHRKFSIPLNGFTIRDQKPMNMAMLERCLCDDTTPPEWLALLNSKVFFWPRKRQVTKSDRLNRFIAKYTDEPLLVMEFSSFRLLSELAKDVSLCHLNTGATRSVAHKRGKSSFIAFHEYLWSPTNEVAEVTVPDRVTDVHRFLDRVSLMDSERDTVVLLERKSADASHIDSL